MSYRSFSVFGVTFTADPRAPRSAVQRAMEFITHAFSAVTTRADMKPEEPDWTVTLAAQAKVAYVNSAEPAQDERFGDWPLRDYVAGYNPLTASPLETAVYHLCKTAVRK